MSPPNYFEAFDHAAVVADYPYRDDFLPTFTAMSRDELRARQEARFARLMAFAWKVPFYRRLWGARGIEPGDIRSLEDIGKLPTYSKDDLMASVAAHPPIGDFHGLKAYATHERPPLVLQTTSGTTGRPQPLLYGPRSREMQNLLLARYYLFQGLTRDDVVHSVYGHGMVNGGHYVRETMLHFVGATILSAGTGVETRSETQVTLMRDFGATAIVGFGDYVKRLADVARAAGIEPGRDVRIRMISGHIGRESPEALGEAWGGAKVFDWYGVGDTGIIAGQGPDRSGMYVAEDAQYLELLDVDEGTPVADGEVGDMVVTCLYKDDVFPIIRFNTHDVTRWVAGPSPTGLVFRRIEGFLGRSDNMVKLRGINVYPQGIGALLAEDFAGLTGEFLCKVTRRDGRDEMTVLVEVTEPDAADADAFARHLRARLGVEVAVEIAVPGALAPLTGIESRQKPIRLIDARKEG